MKRALWLLAAGTIVSGVCAWAAVGRPAPTTPGKPEAAAEIAAKPTR